MCKKQNIKSKNINFVLASFQSKVFTKMCNLRKKKLNILFILYVILESYTNLKTAFYIILIAIFTKPKHQDILRQQNEYQNSGPYQIYEQQVTVKMCHVKWRISSFKLPWLKWTGIRMPLFCIQWFQHSRMILFTRPLVDPSYSDWAWPNQSPSCPRNPSLPAAIILVGRIVFFKTFSTHYSCCLWRVSNVSASKALSPSISYSHNHKK